MSSGDYDYDEIVARMQQLTLDELNDNEHTLVADQEDVHVKEEEDHKPNFPNGDTIASPTGPNWFNVKIFQTIDDRTACCELTDLELEVVEEEDYWRFPDLAVIKIMKFTKEQKTLLNARLVCTQWNQIIEDTSKLMNKITFYVWNLQKFIELPIVKKGKIKSIVIRTTWAPSELLGRFVDAISSSAEKVTFTFTSKYHEEELSPILRLVLKKCVNLYELRFGEYFGYGLLKEDIEETEIAATMKISILSVNVHGLNDVAGLSALLPKLPSLKELELTGIGIGAYRKRGFVLMLWDLIDALNLYLGECDVSSLKKLSLEPIRRHPFSRGHDFQRESGFGLLFMLCGKHGIRMDEMPYVDLKWLLSIDMPLLDSLRYGDGQLLKSRVEAFICFRFNDISYITNLDRLHLFNFDELELSFNRDLVQGELSWIGNLPGLKVITLCGFPMSKSANIELDASFSVGLPSVKALKIRCNVVDSIHVLKLAQYFPNLNELFITSSEITLPDNLIVELTVVQSLSKIVFTCLQNLVDVHFTMECVDRYASSSNNSEDGDNDSSVKAPAIACFKSLKYLYVGSSRQLTDACIINGISKAKTLEKVIIACCKGITKAACEQLIKCKVRYEKNRLEGNFNEVFEDFHFSTTKSKNSFPNCVQS